MKFLIIFISSFLAIQTAHAEWVKLFKNSTETYFIDDESIDLDIKNNIGKLWVKMVIDVKKPTETTVTQKRSYYEISCNDRMLKLLSSTGYNNNNQILASSEPIFPKSMRIIPETVGNDFYKVVCSRLIPAAEEDPQRILLESLESAESCFKRTAFIQKQLVFNRDKLKAKIKLECKDEIKDASLKTIELATHLNKGTLREEDIDALFNKQVRYFDNKIEHAIDNN